MMPSSRSACCWLTFQRRRPRGPAAAGGAARAPPATIVMRRFSAAIRVLVYRPAFSYSCTYVRDALMSFPGSVCIWFTYAFTLSRNPIPQTVAIVMFMVGGRVNTGRHPRGRAFRVRCGSPHLRRTQGGRRGPGLTACQPDGPHGLRLWAVVPADADKCPVLGRILGDVVGGVGPPLGYPDKARF
jgi:hypothetical protein